MSTLTKEQMKALRKRLYDEQRDIQHHFAMEDKGSIRDVTGELTAADNHPADTGTELFERGRDFAIDDAQRRRLAEVEEALSLMEDGNYGKCEACGGRIPYERLEAVPWTRYCVKHTPAQNVSNDRPVEEQVMQPARGSAGHGAAGGVPPRLDDDDAWRTVAGYGNSDSPAMADDPDRFSYQGTENEEADGDGSVEDLEKFTATDIDGKNRRAVRGESYDNYRNRGEGDPLLEPGDNPGAAFREVE